MKNLSKRSKEVIWHPFTQMQIAEAPIGITSGTGTYLYDENGRKYIDAISSWWTCIHGHSHPYITQKLQEQALTLEHVIFAGFTHEPAVELSERLLKILPQNQKKVFFSDNGSTSVEVALKMAFQYWVNKNQVKTKIIAFKESYHGDTFGAMSVGSRSTFTKPFFPFLFDVEFVESPAIDAKLCLEQINEIIARNDVAAIIYEPLIQGAGGMLMYSPKILNEIIRTCKKYNVLCIADEVMTGFYRTGKFFASLYCQEQPDIICLSKGLTGGVMAMSVTTCTQKIYKEFLSNNFMEKTFFHGHSFTANPLACAVANASLDLFEKDKAIDAISYISNQHKKYAKKLADFKCVEKVRTIGTIIAFDLKTDTATNYANSKRDEIKKHFIDSGILIRPLGNTIYLMPPYCIEEKDLYYIYDNIECYLTQITH